jgi:hypothetical protein
MYFFFIAPEATAYELKKTHVIKGAWRLPEITARGAGAGGGGALQEQELIRRSWGVCKAGVCAKQRFCGKSKTSPRRTCF